jgi:hypothetical protein
MPMDRARYPENWKEISKAVKDRAGWKCEACGIKHHTMRLNAKGKPFREFMTTAHLGVTLADGSPGDPRDKSDNRPENLACYCTRCHLLYDLVEHVQNRRMNRFARIAELYGNLTLFEEFNKVS